MFKKFDYNKITEDIAAAVLAVEEPASVRDRKNGSVQINLEGRCEKVLAAIWAAHVAASDIRRGVYEALPKLTLEDIVKFEHDNMANKPWLYLILGDEKNLDMKSLEKIAPIKRVSTEEIFGY